MSVIAVVGVGAVGGTVAARLWAAGRDEVVLCVGKERHQIAGETRVVRTIGIAAQLANHHPVARHRAASAGRRGVEAQANH